MGPSKVNGNPNVGIHKFPEELKNKSEQFSNNKTTPPKSAPQNTEERKMGPSRVPGKPNIRIHEFPKEPMPTEFDNKGPKLNVTRPGAPNKTKDSEKFTTPADGITKTKDADSI